MSESIHSYRLKVPALLWKQIEEHKDKTGRSYRDFILTAVREKLGSNNGGPEELSPSIPVGELPDSALFEVAAKIDINREAIIELAAELRAARLRGEKLPLASRLQAVAEREEKLAEQLEEMMAALAITP